MVTKTQSAEPSLLAQFLRDSAARCPSCGYALRGCESPRCPECGTGLSLGVIGPPRGSTLGGSAILGAGLSLCMATILLLLELKGSVSAVLHDPGIPSMVNAGYRSVSDLPNWRSLFIMGTLVVGLSMLLAWLVAIRREFGNRPRQWQAWVGLACLLSPLELLALLALVCR